MFESFKRLAVFFQNRESALFFLLVGFFFIAFSFQNPDVASLFAAATSSLKKEISIVYLDPDAELLPVGEIINIDINVNAVVPINAVGFTVQFPPDFLEVVSISKSKSFLNLWTEETTIREEAGEIHFSGGTLKKGGLVGVGTALSFSVRAKKLGHAELHIQLAELLANNGLGDAIPYESRTLALDIVNASPLSIESTQRVDEKFSGQSISLMDMSILTMHLFGPYSSRYDINKDGMLNLGDLSAYFTLIKR